jgi:hypothetical protein
MSLGVTAFLMAIRIFLWRISYGEYHVSYGGYRISYGDNQTSYAEYPISYGKYPIAYGEYRNPYGENHIALWRKIFWYGENSLGSITYGGNYPKRDAWLPSVSWRRLLFWLLFLLRLLLPLAACQAQSEPTAQPRVVLYDEARLSNIGSTVGLAR